MPATRTIDIPFPFSGINEVAANRSQPENTTPGALNVRPFDPISRRLRGGQRSGLEKYIADAVNGSNPIQFLGTVSSALDPSTVVADTLIGEDDFTYEDGDLADVGAANWPLCYKTNFGSLTTDGFLVASNEINRTTNYNETYQAIFKSLSVGTAYTIRFDLKEESGGGGAAVNVGWLIQVKASSPTDSCYSVTILQATPTTVHLYWNLITAGSAVQEYVKGSVALPGGGALADKYYTFELRVNGSYCEIYCDGTLMASHTLASPQSNDRIGLCYPAGGVKFQFKIDNFKVYSAANITTISKTTIVTASGGSVYGGTRASGLNIAAGGSGVLSSSRSVAGTEAYQKLYLCDGYYSHYSAYNPSGNSAATWQPTAGQLPGGGVGTSYPITAVDTSAKTIKATGSSVAFAAGDYFELFDSTANDGTYKVTADDGADTLTVAETIPSSVADGSIREATVGCRYATLYRGRIVLWGLFTDPQNWFMSAVGEPLDWDYGPAVTSQTQAIAGNNADAGKLGDVLTACIPYSDDLMIMGGDHTLWVMSGDPAAGGMIDSISYQTGIAGPYAYAWDPEGALYFLGAKQLWKIETGTMTPVPISLARIENTIGEIDLATYEIRMAWDVLSNGLHVNIVPTQEPSSAPIHIYWDRRTDSFWKDQYPVAHGPTCVYAYDADDPDDQALLLGGWDSYIRYIKSAEKDDDGTAISSYCWMTPIVLADTVDLKISSIRAILATGSDPVRLEVHAAETVEAVNASTSARFTKMLAAGRNSPIMQRAVGNAINIKLVNDSDTSRYWALESLCAQAWQSGRQRHGVS